MDLQAGLFLFFLLSGRTWQLALELFGCLVALFLAWLLYFVAAQRGNRVAGTKAAPCHTAAHVRTNAMNAISGRRDQCSCDRDAMDTLKSVRPK